jgi:putative transposase
VALPGVMKCSRTPFSMDFLSYALASGRRFRVLTVVDDHTREAVAIEVDTSLLGLRVRRVLEQLSARRAAQLRQGRRGTAARSRPLFRA